MEIDLLMNLTAMNNLFIYVPNKFKLINLLDAMMNEYYMYQDLLVCG
jgi:hypothetical protein